MALPSVWHPLLPAPFELVEEHIRDIDNDDTSQGLASQRPISPQARGIESLG